MEEESHYDLQLSHFSAGAIVPERMGSISFTFHKTFLFHPVENNLTNIQMECYFSREQRLMLKCRKIREIKQQMFKLCQPVESRSCSLLEMTNALQSLRKNV